MSIQTIHDTGSSYDITSKMDGGIYQVATQDCVVKGIGDEFTLQYTGSSLSATFLAGSEAIIGGSFFKVTTDTTVVLPASSQIYLCSTIDLNQPNGSRGLFTTRTSSNMQYGDINGSGTVRDMLLYIITTNASGVASVTDMRKIVKNGEGVNMLTTAPTSANTDGNYKMVFLTSEPQTKYNGYIYFIKG